MACRCVFPSSLARSLPASKLSLLSLPCWSLSGCSKSARCSDIFSTRSKSRRRSREQDRQPMPRVLIAGCGYVGAATADLLFTRGWEVAGWTRSQESARNLTAKPYPVRAIDIRNRAELAKYCDGFDAVIHCPSTRGGGAELYREVYLDGARNLLERFATSTIIFTSSTSVYAQSDGSWVNEESATEPSHETGRILLRTEKVVLTRGGIVARLAGIYGPGRSALLQKFLSGEAFIAPENDRFINQVHRDDLATALAGLLDRQSARGEIYNVVDNEPILQSACYRWLG